MVEKREQQLLQRIKSRMFDLIEIDMETANKDEPLLINFLCCLKEIVRAEAVDYYRANDLRELLLYAASSEANDSVESVPAGIPLEGTADQLDCFWRKPGPLKGLGSYEVVLFLKEGSIPTGAIGLKLGPLSWEFSDSFLKELSGQCSKIAGKISLLNGVLGEEKRYRQLFRVTEKFHSSMNMDDVLMEVIRTLKEVFPSFSYYLLLSQDKHENCDLPIKNLEYDSGHSAAMQAYVNGSLQFEDSIMERKSMLYAPLKGKQGVYGVLQVIASDTLIFPHEEVEFIMLLASTAGSALENARLYQQSRRINSDLKLINETSHRLNSNLRLADTMIYMCGQMQEAFQADEVGFVSIDEEGSFKVLEGTHLFSTPDSASYLQQIGTSIQRDREPLFIGDYTLEGTYRSVMAVPMIHGDSLKGFALALHREPYKFSFDLFKLMQSLIQHYTLAFANSVLREELEKMVVTDHLTKLYSRKYLDEKVNLSMNQDEYGAFILMDIDNFKEVNDTYGHQVGDEVLIQVANLIRTNIRASDIGSRWGGEELAVYLPGAPLDTGVLIANRLAEMIGEWTTPCVTVSCGVAVWTKEKGDTLLGLFRRADQALYAAKESGKNKVIIHGRKDGFLSTP